MIRFVYIYRYKYAHSSLYTEKLMHCRAFTCEHIFEGYPQPQQLMSVTVPMGVYGGQMLSVRAPSGAVVQVQVPLGMQPGMTFQAQMPMVQQAPIVVQQPQVCEKAFC